MKTTRLLLAALALALTAACSSVDLTGPSIIDSAQESQTHSRGIQGSGQG